MWAVDGLLNFLVTTFSKYKETGKINFNNLTIKSVISGCTQHKNFSIDILYSIIQSYISKSTGVFTLLGHHLQVLNSHVWLGATVWDNVSLEDRSNLWWYSFLEIFLRCKSESSVIYAFSCVDYWCLTLLCYKDYFLVSRLLYQLENQRSLHFMYCVSINHTVVTTNCISINSGDGL